MKNKILTILFATLFTVAFIPTYVFAEDGTKSVPNTINLTSSTGVPGYITNEADGNKTITFGTKTMKDGTLVYCLDYAKQTTVNTTATLKKEMDAGMAYLMQNGYPNKSFTGNKNIDYYITQVAVYWYLDETTGSKNLTDSFKTTDSDPKNLRPTIKKLVDDAVAANKKGYVDPTLSLSVSNSNLTLNSDNTYFISDEINANANNSYTVTLDGAPEGSFVADINGNKKDTFNAGENFKVYVPVNKDGGADASFKVNAVSTGTIYKVYQYDPADSREQSLVTPILYPESKTVNGNVVLSLTYPKVVVPDTSSSSIIFYIIGALLISSGIVLTARYAKNK